MSLEYLLSFVCLFLDTVLITLMVWSRAFRALPIFFSYLIWNLCSSAVGLMLARTLSPTDYLRFYLAEMTMDGLFEFAFLFELARSVRIHNHILRPGRRSRIRILLLAILLIVSLSSWNIPEYLPPLYKFYLHTQQAITILRVAIILSLCWWSSLQFLRWSDRELRVVTGAGLYSFVALAVSILHTHQTVGPLYRWLDELMRFSYVCALAYWIFAFSPREPEPQAPLSTNAFYISGRGLNRKGHKRCFVEFHPRKDTQTNEP